MWLLVLSLGMWIDLHGLQNVDFVKYFLFVSVYSPDSDCHRRSLSHVGCCLFIMYIAISTVKPDSDHVLSWIPIIIDIGLGASMGIQEIPPDQVKRGFKYLTDFLGSICGGINCLCPGSRFSGSSP